jgi:transcriptional regulator PpsR
VRPFKAPRASLGNLDIDAAAALIAAASDVTLVLDATGVIRDIAFQSEELSQALADWSGWIGMAWIDTVTSESRPKITQLLGEIANAAPSRWRHLNHPLPDGATLPILYSVVPAGEDGRVVVFGRDLRAISALQQRLVNAQESIERDYTRLQHVETRYRLLFQTSPEAVLILDSVTRRVTEANPAAAPLLGDGARGALGRPFLDLFDPASVSSVESLLGAVRAAGRGDDVRARLLPDQREVVVSASLFRHDNASLYLIRLTPVSGDAGTSVMPKLKGKLLKVVESAPDGFVVTDSDARVVTANAAFIEMTQLNNEDQVRGEPLDRWLGRPGVDVEVLTANVRQRGSVRLFATVMRAEYGTTADVEVSGVSVMNGGQPCMGFAIRNVGRRLTVDTKASRELPRSVEHLTELIGRVSLKDLVREATDVIERLCIEAALELTGDNRASAAEMLGLSRQSLYVKLRRYGLGDLAEDGKA